MTNVPSTVTELRGHDAPSSAAWVRAVQIAVLGALVILVFLPSLDFMVAKWRTDGDWSHGWLVPLFSLYFLNSQRDRLRSEPRRTNFLGLVMMVGSLVLYYFAVVYQFFYPQRLMIVPFLMGLVLFTYGWRISRIAWFPIAYLLLAIPLPGWIHFQMTIPLRRFASQAAGMLLGLFPKVYTEVTGVVIDYDYLGRTGSLNIEEACSGMRLMMAFIALGVAVAYLGVRPFWQRVVLVISCVPIAVFCNMLRVFITGVIHIFWDRQLSQGTAHSLLGLAMLPIALGLLTAIGWVLSNLFVESVDEGTPESE